MISIIRVISHEHYGISNHKHIDCVFNSFFIQESPKAQHNYPFISLGAVSIRKTVLPGMAIPMLKIRRPNGRLIFNMEIAIRR